MCSDLTAHKVDQAEVGACEGERLELLPKYQQADRAAFEFVTLTLRPCAATIGVSTSLSGATFTKRDLMNRFTSIASGALCACIWGHASLALSATQVLTITNVDPHSPACVIMVVQGMTQCTADECVIPFSNGRAVQPVQLKLSCIPTSAPTGFENPPYYAQLYSVAAKNAKGHLSVIDDSPQLNSAQMRELNFCLWGNSNILCGFAKISSKDPRSAQREAVQTFIRGIEFTDPLVGAMNAAYPHGESVRKFSYLKFKK
jgi:hypothetical protein